MALVTTDECRAYIPSLTVGSSGGETELLALVARANARLAQHCGFPEQAVGVWTLESAAYTLHVPHRAADGKLLRLPIRPVTAITSIEDDPTWTWDGSTYLVASSDYTLRSKEGQVLLKDNASHRWSSGGRDSLAIKVVCTAGFATTPDYVKHAACLLVAYWYRRSLPYLGEDRGQAQAVERGGVPLVTGDLPIEVQQAIAPARVYEGLL